LFHAEHLLRLTFGLAAVVVVFFSVDELNIERVLVLCVRTAAVAEQAVFNAFQCARLDRAGEE
jgi:hypothetical protein